MDASKAGIICIVFEAYVGFVGQLTGREKLVFGVFPRNLPVQGPTKL